MPVLTDPVAAGQPQEQRSVEAARRAEVDILDGGGVPQLGGARAGLEALLLGSSLFGVDGNELTPAT